MFYPSPVVFDVNDHSRNELIEPQLGRFLGIVEGAGEVLLFVITKKTIFLFVPMSGIN